MTLATIREEIASWPAEDQDQLAAYLTVLRHQRSQEHADELSRRLDDRSPENWLTLDEVKARLRRGADPA